MQQLRCCVCLQEPANLYEGLFLAATLGGMLIARATPDGRLSVLHILARPPDARQGCLPYPTWRPTTLLQSSAPAKYDFSDSSFALHDAEGLPAAGAHTVTHASMFSSQAFSPAPNMIEFPCTELAQRDKSYQGREHCFRQRSCCDLTCNKNMGMTL